MTTDQIEKLLRKKAQEGGITMASAFVKEFEKEAVFGEFEEEVSTYHVCYDVHEYVKSLPFMIGDDCNLMVKMYDNSTVTIDKINGFYCGQAEESDVWFGGDA